MRLGLRLKFFVHSNALILVTMSLVTYLAIRHERRASHDRIEQRGRSITEVLAIPITDALLYQELGLVTEEGLIDNYVSEVLARNRDLVRYVVVTDTSGRVTHSNRWDLLGKPFARALGTDAIGAPTISESLTTPGGESIIEVRTPLAVSSHHWGSLAVGFSLSTVEQDARQLTANAVLVGLVLMLLNSLLTAIYVESLIRPVLHLHRTMKAASEGDLTVRAEGGQGDEVHELGDAFNRMMDELEDARKREKAQEAQLARTEKMAAVGTLAAGVAHEVNNPVAGILTCLDMLEANGGTDPALCKRYLALVRDGVKRIEHTVVNLLDFSRPRELERKRTSLNERLQHVVELAGYQLRKGRVAARLELSPAGAFILADPFQMEQLFLNLVLNAIQAMPDGGSLTVRTRDTGRWVAAEVVDTGVGIPESIRDRVFDPFFTTRDVGKGTGLGLSVSYGIVSAHGGSIELESEAGKGTTFRVVLPAAEDGAAREVG